ncbi:unnamed protein product, partial [Prorocentrum cordatum]
PRIVCWPARHTACSEHRLPWTTRLPRCSPQRSAAPPPGQQRQPHRQRRSPQRTPWRSQGASPRTRSPRHQRRRSCTTPPRSRPPAQSTIGSSTSTLSQWCSWSTQAPPCWTSEGTGLVILFLSLSISLSDFSAPSDSFLSPDLQEA